MSNNKPFDINLYNENNSLAIIIAANYLLSTGYYYFETNPLEQPEVFKDSDFTILLKSDNRKIKVEVERKKSWKKSKSRSCFK